MNLHTYNQAVQRFQSAQTMMEKITVAINYFEKANIVNEQKENNQNSEYPPLLSASHISEILNVSKATAYEIMRDPRRPVWRSGKRVRMHRDLFFQQLEEETQPKIAQ